MIHKLDGSIIDFKLPTYSGMQLKVQ